MNGNTATAAPGAGGPPIAAGGIANGGAAVLTNTQVNNNTASHTSGGGIVKLIVSPRSGRTESRLCFRVAQATYADTTRDATAMTTPQIAMTVFASTGTSQPGKRPGLRTSMPSDISSRAATTDANRGHYGPLDEGRA